MMGEALCKGDWMLGTACGECERCRATAASVIKTLREQLDLKNAAAANGGVNGVAPPAALMRTAIPMPEQGGAKIVYTSPKGHWLGEIFYMTTSAPVLKLMSDDFSALVREATSTIIRPGTQPAQGQPVPPL